MNLPWNVDYLVGGLRIAVDQARSNTPGPRSHILGTVEALRRRGNDVQLSLVSDLPLMGRFAAVRQSDYKDASRTKVVLSDAVRVACAFWGGAWVFARSVRSRKPYVIYERAAVLQSLSSFHFHKRRAIRVVEANGILSRETSVDRKALAAVRAARIVERHVLRRADLVVAVSEPLKRELLKFAGLSKERVLVLPNGVDSELTRRSALKASDRIIVGFLGSLAGWQHLPDLVQMFAQARPDLIELAGGRDVEFRIVGDGAARAEIEDVVAKLGVARHVRVLGKMSRDDALSECSTWHVGIAGHMASSSVEMYHSPLKVYEYAAMGLAIACTPSDDAQMVQSAGAGVFTYETATQFIGALGRAIEFAAASSLESTEQIRRAIADQHSWDARVDQLVAMIDALGTAQVARHG